jgi:hypothetical protein
VRGVVGVWGIAVCRVAAAKRAWFLPGLAGLCGLRPLSDSLSESESSREPSKRPIPTLVAPSVVSSCGAGMVVAESRPDSSK